jgi:predicted nucleotidyltransferase
MDVAQELAPRLAAMPGVLAVTLGGSRARGEHRFDSDWDFGVYYRGGFDARELGGLGYPGHVAQPGEWGRLANGGAWLSVQGRAVDVLLRDLDQIERWWADARHGLFEIDNVEGHLAGLPTYTPVGEIALGQLLFGELPPVTYPDRLREVAAQRWRWNSAFSLEFADQYLQRNNKTLAAGMISRATAQAAHSVLASRGEWILNEKRLVARAGLEEADTLLGGLWTIPAETLSAVRALIAPPALAELFAHRN